MKLTAKIIFLFFLLFFKNIFAQNVSILQSDFINYQSANYIGSNTQFHYFSAYKDMKLFLLKTNINDLKLVYEEAITFNDLEENFKDMFVCENYLYKISYIGQREIPIYDGSVDLHYTISTVKTINLYKYNAITNELINKAVLKVTGAFTIEDEPKIYEKQRLILIQNSFYNYDLKELKTKKVSVFSDYLPTDSLHPYEKTFVSAYSYFPQAPNLANSEITTIVTTKKTKEIYGFSIKYEGTTDHSVAVFKEYLHHITIKSKMGTLNDMELDLPENKKIIDLHFKTNVNKELIVLGKFAEENDNMVNYGFFTMKYDSNLNEINDVKYTPLIETTTKNKGLKDNIYFNLFFTKLTESFYYDVIGENTQLFFFQHIEINLRLVVNYNLKGGDILILTINKSGELKIKKIPLKHFSRMTGYCLMHVVISDEKVHLLYYDHKDNINKADNEAHTLCELTTENTVLLGTTIDLESLEMSPKKMILSCDQYKTVPPSFPFKSYYNGYFNANIFFTFKDGYIYQFTFN